MKRHKKQSRVRELTTFVVRTRPGHRKQGLISMRGRIFRCALGSGGIRARKREGDGITPLGRWKLDRVLYRGDRVSRPFTMLPARPLRKSDGWCDEPGDRNYNRPVLLPYRGHCEALWREDILYNIVIIMNFNIRPRVQGRGSAIFVHVAREGLAPTEGCIALSTEDLRAILRIARPGTILDIRG